MISIARRIASPGGRLNSFIDETRARGEDPGVVWINKTYAQPIEEEATALQVPVTTRVARLGRVRLAGGEPLAIEHAVIPAPFLPDLDTLGDSLYQALERHGFRPVAGTQRVRASLATPSTMRCASKRVPSAATSSTSLNCLLRQKWDTRSNISSRSGREARSRIFARSTTKRLR